MTPTLSWLDAEKGGVELPRCGGLHVHVEANRELEKENVRSNVLVEQRKGRRSRSLYRNPKRRDESILYTDARKTVSAISNALVAIYLKHVLLKNEHISTYICREMPYNVPR